MLLIPIVLNFNMNYIAPLEPSVYYAYMINDGHCQKKKKKKSSKRSLCS